MQAHRMRESSLHLNDDVRTIFEDEWLIAVSKPSGLLSHSNPGREDEDSLENILRAKMNLPLILFHRLDRDTSGLVLLGKRREIAGLVTRAFEEKKIRKSYLAVVEGQWRADWNRVDQPIESKSAVTTFRLLAGGDHKSWIEALPKTGRQHQIRIHCQFHQRPIVGDTRYGARASLPSGSGFALHAYRMDFYHPKTGEKMRIVDEPSTAWRERYLGNLDHETAWNKLFRRQSEKPT
jgi:RluA family pseudouridine synthase